MIKTINELKKEILKNKKINPELSKSYSAILKHIESQIIGVKNPETDEVKLIIIACKKELKEQIQSRESGAPFSSITLAVCDDFIKELSPKQLTETELKEVLSNETFTNMGQIMGFIKKNYADSVDMKMASKLAKELLQ